MTEDDARTKLCCGPDDCGRIEHSLSGVERLCAGAACMAFLLEKTLVVKIGDPVDPSASNYEACASFHDPDGQVRFYQYEYVKHYFCGLAGKP